MKKRIYLDSNASTPLDPLIVQTIYDTLGQSILNPSSLHIYGQEAKGLLDKARRIIADYFEVKASQVIFTSSGTESMNMLIRSYLAKGGEVVSSLSEHSAVYNLLQNYKTHAVSPGKRGAPLPAQVEQAITPQTSLICLMAVNNETGVKTDIEAVGKIALERKIPFIVDGVAWLGKENIKIPKGVDAMGFSGHKIHAPPGVGFVIVQNQHKLSPLILGGAQEFNRRAGTENLLGIAALGRAIELIDPSSFSRMAHLRDTFESRLKEHFPGLVVNGEGERISNTSNLLFPGIDGETFLIKLDQAGIQASLGSACSSGAIEPSRVLISMGLSYKEAKRSLRFSFNRFNTENDVEEAISRIKTLIP
jgi:cysteine desulfurase